LQSALRVHPSRTFFERDGRRLRRTAVLGLRRFRSEVRRITGVCLLAVRRRLLDLGVSAADTAGRCPWGERAGKRDEALGPGTVKDTIREYVNLGRVPRRTRFDVLLLYATRTRRRKPAKIRLKEGCVYLDPQSLLADWFIWYEIFSPRHAVYSSDYEDAVVVDVGAHKGYFSAFVLLSGARTVFSYEPEATNFSLLKPAAGSFDVAERWLIRNAAVGAQPRTAKLHVASGLWGSWSHSLVEQRDLNGQQSQTVDVVSMSSVLHEAAALGGRRLIVKIDAEGAECEIVLGTTPRSWELVEEIFLEHHGFAPCTINEIVSHLERAGLARQHSRGQVQRFCRGAP
jgi:FkbM family methyltransferase